MATIARLVVELSAKTSEFHKAMQDSVRATRDTQRQLESSAQAVTLLQDRLTTLQRAFRTGAIDEQAFARHLRTLQADVAELATQANLTETSMARLSRVGQGVNRELRNVTALARRTADGFEALGVGVLAASQAATGGVAGFGRAAGTLQVFALGNPWLIGILSGLTLLAQAWELIRNRSRETAVAVNTLTREELKRAQLQAQLAAARETDPIRAAQRRGVSAMAAQTLDQVTSHDALLRMLQGAVDKTTVRLVTERSITQELRRQAALLTDANFGKKGVVNIAPTGDFLADVERQKRLAEAAAGVGMAALSGAGSAIQGRGMLDGLQQTLQQAKQIGGEFLDVGAMIGQGLIALAASVGQGFQAMAGVAMGILGGLMVEVGKSMILFGAAMKALRQAIKNPVAAIAAGAALVVLGTALQASAQRSVNAATGGGGGGGSSAAAPFGAPGLPAGGSQGEGGSRTLVLVGDALGIRDQRRLDDLADQMSWLAGRRIAVEHRDA